MTNPDLSIVPLTPDRWDAFARLFGPRGACAGCWCMWWRRTRKQWEANKGDGNRDAMRALVDAGAVPGLLATDPASGEPVGWVAIAPRADHASLGRSRVLKPLDDRPVWSLVCLFVTRPWRGRGVARALVEAAVAHARERGAPAVEAYPTVPRTGRLPDISSFMGTPALFAGAGFVEVARPSTSRMIMRRELG